MIWDKPNRFRLAGTAWIKAIVDKHNAYLFRSNLYISSPSGPLAPSAHEAIWS